MFYQQQPEKSCTPTPLLLSQEKQLLTLIASLQQQVNTILQQQGGSQVKVAKSSIYRGKIEKVSAITNSHLLICDWLI